MPNRSEILPESFLGHIETYKSTKSPLLKRSNFWSTPSAMPSYFPLKSPSFHPRDVGNRFFRESTNFHQSTNLILYVKKCACSFKRIFSDVLECALGIFSFYCF